MNKIQMQWMSTKDRPDMRVPVFSTENDRERSNSDKYYEQVRERFMQQSACYLRSCINQELI